MHNVHAHDSGLYNTVIIHNYFNIRFETENHGYFITNVCLNLVLLLNKKLLAVLKLNSPKVDSAGRL